MADLINNLDSLHKEYTIVYTIESNTYYSEKVIENYPILYPTTFTPTKSGWEFVGWRKDNTASSSVLINETATSSITLFAVFRQAVTCTFKSYNKSETVTGYRYYNNGNVANASIKAPTGATMSGCTWRGWSAAGTTTGNASVSYANGGTISGLTAAKTYYGLYSATITLSYNGNGNSSGSTSSQTGTRYYNAYGNYTNPSFTLASCGFAKSGHTFLNWAQGSATGTAKAAGTSVTLTANTTFYAVWVKYIFNKNYVSGGVTAFTKQTGAGSKGTCSLVEGSYFRMTSQWVSGQSLGNITCKSNSISVGSYSKLHYVIYLSITSTKTENQVCSIAVGSKSKSFTLPTSRTKFEGDIDISSLSGSQVITLDLDVGIYNYNNNKAIMDVVQLYLA